MKNLINTIKEQDATTKTGLTIVALIIAPLAVTCLVELMKQAEHFNF